MPITMQWTLSPIALWDQMWDQFLNSHRFINYYNMLFK